MSLGPAILKDHNGVQHRGSVKVLYMIPIESDERTTLQASWLGHGFTVVRPVVRREHTSALAAEAAIISVKATISTGTVQPQCFRPRRAGQLTP